MNPDADFIVSHDKQSIKCAKCGAELHARLIDIALRGTEIDRATKLIEMHADGNCEEAVNVC